MPGRALTVRALVLAAAALALPAPGAGAYPNPGVVAGDTTVHDPSLVIRGATPRYVLASTHNQTRLSADRITFVGTGGWFPIGVPEWTKPYGNGDTWAPDVSFHDGKYWLYYAASTVGSQHSAIGLATSTTAEPGSWTDRGKVIDTDWNDGVNYNAIDPNLLVDASGRWWLTFGSYWDGIYQVELDPATGKVKAGATPANVARRPGSNTAIEGPSMFRHGGWYYLFASFDSCCPALVNPSPPTYHIMVGRSTSPNGPFLDRNGTDMRSGGGTLVLGTHDWVVGPGGQSVVHDPSDDHDLLVYHYYDSRANYTAFLGINYLGFDGDGWPYVW
jgi:arabinan endo-1,5-alpha-L-arabinosidase